MVTLGTKLFKCVNLSALVVVHRNHRVATVTYINNLSHFKTICLFFLLQNMKKTCRLPVRNSEHLKICHYMCVFRTEISQFRFWRPVTGEAPTEHISYSEVVVDQPLCEAPVVTDQPLNEGPVVADSERPVADQLSEHDTYSEIRVQTTHLVRLMMLQSNS